MCQQLRYIHRQVCGNNKLLPLIVIIKISQSRGELHGKAMIFNIYLPFYFFLPVKVFAQNLLTSCSVAGRQHFVGTTCNKSVESTKL
jgi:hypothetical protein